MSLVLGLEHSCPWRRECLSSEWLSLALASSLVSSTPPLCTRLGKIIIVIDRGGVEDTRLEAKVKDTKKIQGQGQPFRGQTLSRPRTGMLKAKDQGHKCKCSPKKKGLHKNFSGDLHKKTFSKNFFRRSTKF